MKIVKKNVYYCDHCKKRTLSGGSMKVHEKHCTANPDRKCRLCENFYGQKLNIGEIIAEYKLRYKLVEKMIADRITGKNLEEVTRAEWTGEPVTIGEIRNKVNGCPNCMLAIIRQCKFAYHYFEEMITEKFDYKKEMDEVMVDLNREPNDY